MVRSVEWRRKVGASNIHQLPPFSPDSCGKKGSAKARLQELCCREHWKNGVYDCCNEQGPPHSKLFTFKVVLNIELAGESRETVECFGNPRSSKRAAAEDAAEAALWCFKHMGFQL